MKSATNIVLIIPPSRWSDPRYSLGIMYISSFLSKKGYICKIIDDTLMMTSNYSDEEAYAAIINRVKQDCPQFVGYSCLINEIQEVLEMNRRIRQANPAVKTIVGGTQAFDTPELFIKNDIDFVVSGEGEITTWKLLDCILKGDLPFDISGIIWKNGKEIIHNPARALINNLSEIPHPAYDMVNMKRHISIQSGIIRGLPLRTAMVLTSRGCPYSCSFCECNAIFGRSIRYREITDISAEIEVLKNKYGAEAIWFVDDTLTVNKKHLVSICEAMKKFNMWWGCQGRSNTIDEEMIRTMKGSGCIQIDFGVESGSDRILNDIINKSLFVDETRTAFKLCHKYRMRTLANLMIGLPSETKEEMFQTLRLGIEINADSYVLSIATPLPNTQLWDMVKPDIDEAQLHRLNFFDSEILEKFNKSQVRDLVKLREMFLDRLNRNSRIAKKVRNYLWYLKIFTKTRYKGEYILYFRKIARRRIVNIFKVLDKRSGLALCAKFSRLKDWYYYSGIFNSIRRWSGSFANRVKYSLFLIPRDGLKLHLGCGNIHFNDYINIDMKKTCATDMVSGITKLPFPDNSTARIEAYHVIEHLPRHELPKALKEWHRILNADGKLIIECPDFDEVVKEYLEGNSERINTVYGLQRYPGDTHFFGYNFERLKKLLTKSGFCKIERKPPRDYHSLDEPCLRIKCSRLYK